MLGLSRALCLWLGHPCMLLVPFPCPCLRCPCLHYLWAPLLPCHCLKYPWSIFLPCPCLGAFYCSYNLSMLGVPLLTSTPLSLLKESIEASSTLFLLEVPWLTSWVALTKVPFFVGSASPLFQV